MFEDHTMLKDKAVASLGHTSLLLPAMIKSALAANDRLKIYLTLVQAAGQQARHPDQASDRWVDEFAAGLLGDPAWLTELVNGAYLNDQLLVMPHGSKLLESMASDLAVMARPVCEACNDAPAQWQKRRDDWVARLEILGTSDGLEPEALVSLTHGKCGENDSLHLFVMDLHKSLNALSQALATEHLEGAHVWQIDDTDRPLIRAFMTGLNRTAPLKFSHPGLDTAATRDGPRLLIQNDIGTNDAHVLVIEVEDLCIQLTYSDLHGRRFDFFRQMLEDIGFSWTLQEPVRSDGLNAGKPYRLGRAQLTAEDRMHLCRALEAVAAQIVFVIDWNRARKQLQFFVSKSLACSLLTRAAREQWGHMAWLLAGGKQLVFETMQSADNELFRVGDRLDEVLGEAAAVDFLAGLLRIASQILLRQQPVALVADEARLQLLRAVRQRSIEFDLLAEHAGLCHALGEALIDALQNGSTWDEQQINAHVLRSKNWERAADHLVINVRQRAERQQRWLPIMSLLTRTDDVADNLEEAIFIHALMLESGAGLSAAVAAQIAQLADTTLVAIQDQVSAVEIARQLTEVNAPEDSEAFLQALWRIVRAERLCDDLARKARRCIVTTLGTAPAAMLLANDLTACLEQTSDALLESAYALREMLFNKPGMF